MLSFRGLHLTSISPEFIRQLQEGGIDPAAVVSLNVADNELSSPIDVFGCLTHLDLSFNNISIIRGIPVTVTHLNLSHNNLEQFYNDYSKIFGLDSLLSLYDIDLSHNKLADMTGLYSNIELRIVKMGGNRIPSVSSLESLRNLESLDLSANKILLLDDLRCLSFNVHLKSLWLVGNPVTKLQGYKVTCRNMLPGLYTLDGKKLCFTNKESEVFQKSTILPNERIDGRRNYGTSLILRSYNTPSPNNISITNGNSTSPNFPSGSTRGSQLLSNTPYLLSTPPRVTPDFPNYPSSPSLISSHPTFSNYPPSPPTIPSHLRDPIQMPLNFTNQSSDETLKAILPPNLASILPPPHIYSAPPESVFLVQQTTLPARQQTTPPPPPPRQRNQHQNHNQQYLNQHQNEYHKNESSDVGTDTRSFTSDASSEREEREEREDDVSSDEPKPIFRSYSNRSHVPSKSSTLSSPIPPKSSTLSSPIPPKSSALSSPIPPKYTTPPRSNSQNALLPKNSSSPIPPKSTTPPPQNAIPKISPSSPISSRKITHPSISPKDIKPSHSKNKPKSHSAISPYSSSDPSHSSPPRSHSSAVVSHSSPSPSTSPPPQNTPPRKGDSATLSSRRDVNHHDNESPLSSPHRSEASHNSTAKAANSVEHRESQTKNSSRSNSARALLASVVEQKKQLMHNMEMYRKQFPKSEDVDHPSLEQLVAIADVNLRDSDKKA